MIPKFLDTPGRKLIGTKYPIIQAGMGFLARHALAAAVSNAGGLGVIGGHYFDPADLKVEIEKAQKLTDKPFAVNMLLYTTPDNKDYAERTWGQVRTVLESDVPIITTGLGNPWLFIAEAHRRGKKVISLVGNVKTAKKVAAIGVDGIVAQGWEAAGHNSSVASMALTPQIVDAVKVPVFLAGGVGDGRGVLAALCLGAQGIMCGTIFAAAQEAYAHMNYKNMIVAADEMGTVVTRAVSGKPTRILRNAWTDYYDQHPEEILPFPKQWLKNEREGVVAVVREFGFVDKGPAPGGQISGLVKGVISCQQIMDNLINHAVALAGPVLNPA